MIIHPNDIWNKAEITREETSTSETLENEIRLALWRVSEKRRSSKLFFDFDDEGTFETGRQTKKANQAIDDMASALKFGRCKRVSIFRNSLKGITIACK